MRRGIPFSLCLAALCAAPAAASSDEYRVRHDTKLERMIMERVATKIGEPRGTLNSEWRPATVMDRLSGLSSIEMSVIAPRPDSPQGQSATTAGKAGALQTFITITSSAGVRRIGSGAP